MPPQLTEWQLVTELSLRAGLRIPYGSLCRSRTWHPGGVSCVCPACSHELYVTRRGSAVDGPCEQFDTLTCAWCDTGLVAHTLSSKVETGASFTRVFAPPGSDTAFRERVRAALMGLRNARLA